MTTTNETPVAVAREIVYALFYSQEHDRAARDERNTEQERREHARQVRALDKAMEQMLAGNMPRSLNIPDANVSGIYFVNSRTSGGAVYRVDTQRGSCTCEGRGNCWHYSAAQVCEDVAEGERALADYLALSTRAALSDDEGARLHMLSASPYLAFIRATAPERLQPAQNAGDLSDEAALWAAVEDHERAPAPYDYLDSDVAETVTEPEADETQALAEILAGVTDDMVIRAADADLYPHLSPHGFRGDIGI